MSLPANGSLEHGTPSTYANHKCRCDACRAANTAYHRRRRAERDPAMASVHGTASTYTNYRCRCRPCTDAHANCRRQRAAS